jgi:RND family efflux transporter MFP subunit
MLDSTPAPKLTALALLTLTAFACGGPHEEAARAPQTPVTVQTTVAALEEVPAAFEATGSVEPWSRVAPGTKIMGRIQEVLVREGDRVKKSQRLALIEKRDLEAALQQSRAAVRMAEAKLENARVHYERMVELHGRGSVTDKNLEDALAGFRTAEAALEQARANQAAARVTLSYAEIRSPVDGWVTAKLVEAGDMASPGMPMFHVEDLSRVKVAVAIPESEVVGLVEEDHARVRVDVLDAEWEATVDRIIPAGDPASRTFQVQLELPNEDGRLKSGMFARVMFSRGARQALLVPATSVVERGQLIGLFVVDADGHARLRWVRLGKPVADRVEVLSGLAPGDRFVVSPPPTFADGTPVQEG